MNLDSTFVRDYITDTAQRYGVRVPRYSVSKLINNIYAEQALALRGGFDHNDDWDSLHALGLALEVAVCRLLGIEGEYPL